MTRAQNIQRKLGLLAAALVLCLGVLALGAPALASASDLDAQKQGDILASEALERHPDGFGEGVDAVSPEKANTALTDEKTLEGARRRRFRRP